MRRLAYKPNRVQRHMRAVGRYLTERAEALNKSVSELWEAMPLVGLEALRKAFAVTLLSWLPVRMCDVFCPISPVAPGARRAANANSSTSVSFGESTRRQLASARCAMQALCCVLGTHKMTSSTKTRMGCFPQARPQRTRTKLSFGVSAGTLPHNGRQRVSNDMQPDASQYLGLAGAFEAPSRLR